MHRWTRLARLNEVAGPSTCAIEIRYVELHGELPKLDDRCDADFDSRDNDGCLDIMPSHWETLFEPWEQAEEE